MNSPISPLPEAIDGSRWTVKEGSGSCDTVSRILGVPMDDSAGSRFIRNHELGHAKITPRKHAFKLCKLFGLSMVAMQVCEDLRVHRYLRRIGVAVSGSLSDSEAEEMVLKTSASDRLLAAHLVASMHTDDYGRVLSAFIRHIDEARVEHLTRMARLVDNRMGEGRGLERPIGFRNGTVPAARLFDAVFPEAGIPSPQLPLDCLFVPQKGRPAKWGEMQIQRLDSERSRPIPAVARGRTFCDHGAVLSAPYRLPVDGRVFLRRRRQRGGTVLIDASGSMCFGPAELQRITAAAPLATVAIYAGRGVSGTLAIVTARGRMASSSDIGALLGRGNVVDGPALRWLAQQPEPRIWISDGQVTGAHDQPSTDLVVDAIRICQQAGIRRASTADSIESVLESHKGGSR
jgi:hypothetical protein